MSADDLLKLLGFIVPFILSGLAALIAWANGTTYRKQTESTNKMIVSTNDAVFKAFEQLRKELERSWAEVKEARKETERTIDKAAADLRALRSDFDVERGRMEERLEAARSERDKLDKELDNVQRQLLNADTASQEVLLQLQELQQKYKELSEKYGTLGDELKGAIAMNEEKDKKLAKAAQFMRWLGLSDSEIDNVLAGTLEFDQVKVGIARKFTTQELPAVPTPLEPLAPATPTPILVQLKD